MNYTVDPWNNFCRVFLLPTNYPTGYCFNGGHPINFQLVDWFHPVPEAPNAAVSRETWQKAFEEGNAPEIPIIQIDGDIKSKELEEFLQRKVYMRPGRSYLVICEFGLCLTFKKS